MKIVVGSAFRNMSGRVNRYFKQIYALQQHVGPDHPVRVIAVEGDSYDETELELAHMAELWETPITIKKHEHGKRVFSSTEEPDRLKALTGVSNAVFGQVKAAKSGAARAKADDVLLYVESDLLWTPHDVGSLIDIAYEQREGFDIIAPLVYAGDAFYDIWGFRGKDGDRFRPTEPFHKSLPVNGLVEINSAGSCMAMRAEVAVAVKNNSDNALVGWCAAARRKKYRIGCAVDFRVDHP